MRNIAKRSIILLFFFQNNHFSANLKLQENSAKKLFCQIEHEVAPAAFNSVTKGITKSK